MAGHTVAAPDTDPVLCQKDQKLAVVRPAVTTAKDHGSYSRRERAATRDQVASLSTVSSATEMVMAVPPLRPPARLKCRRSR